MPKKYHDGVCAYHRICPHKIIINKTFDIQKRLSWFCFGGSTVKPEILFIESNNTQKEIQYWDTVQTHDIEMNVKHVYE